LLRSRCDGQQADCRTAHRFDIVIVIDKKIATATDSLRLKPTPVK
jgi:hypothetical protein